MQDPDQSEEVVDPLLKRLQDKYTKQRSEQLAERRRRLEKDLNAQAVRNSTLPPSVELLSDETAHAFNELDALLASEPANRRALEQLRAIRTAVNHEMRQSLSYIEEGYSSAFHTLMSEAQLLKSNARAGQAGGVLAPTTAATTTAGAAPPLVGQQHTPPPPLTSCAPAEKAPSLVSTLAAPGGTLSTMREAVVQACPPEWRTGVKNAVANEMIFQSANQLTRLPRKLNVQEALSSVTGLFAESLATMLHCEVVRVYLYDDCGNLHCCAAYPSTNPSGDPMYATYTEVMLAKELHHAVCTKGIALNGSEAQYNMLGRRAMEMVRQEAEASGWGSMRSCLVFPILFHEGSGRTCGGSSKGRLSAGMIHAVNKVSASVTQPARFSEDDEVLMSMCARTLGCILTRYPVHYFTLRVGEAIRAAAHPNEGPVSPRGHLPEMLPDVVEDAALVGMQAVLSPQPLMILRAPISEIYQTRTHRLRNRKLGNLVTNDSALSTVEFNLSAVSELWQTGMEDNVLMHSQYRALDEQMTNTKMLMRNLLDGLAAARAMHDATEIARYLQTLELLARSDKPDLLAEFISSNLLKQTSDRASSPREPATLTASHSEAISRTPSRVTLATDVALTLPSSSGAAAESARLQRSPRSGVFSGTEEAGSGHTLSGDGDPFLSPRAAAALLRAHERLNAKVASRIHSDGPEGIRTYSSDPASKRRQIEFICETQRQRVEEHRRRLREEDALQQGRGYLQATASTAAAAAAATGVAPREVMPALQPPAKQRTVAAPAAGISSSRKPHTKSTAAAAPPRPR